MADALFVLPGEQVTFDHEAAAAAASDRLDPSAPLRVRLGPGLVAHAGRIVAEKKGYLHERPAVRDSGPQMWVEGTAKAYVPATKDLVVGTVVSRHAEHYRVQIGAAHLATLGILEFEGATKRNRPQLEQGALVYAQVLRAHKNMEPELTCVHMATGQASGLGELPAACATVVTVPLHTALALLNPQNGLFNVMADHFDFTTSVGLNGRIHIQGSEFNDVITLQLALQAVSLRRPSDWAGIARAVLARRQAARGSHGARRDDDHAMLETL